MTAAGGGRATRAAQTRARILESARRVLAEEGIEGFTTRRVAQLADLSHGMVHYHFETKRDLVLALVVHARRDWVEPLEELVDGPGSAETRMAAVISWVSEPATHEVIRLHTGLFAYALQDDAVRERLAAEYARWRAPFVTLFEQLAEETGMSVGEARVLATADLTPASAGAGRPRGARGGRRRAARGVRARR